MELKNKKKALELLDDKDILFNDEKFDNFRGDKDVVKKAISFDTRAFLWASDEIRDNDDFYRQTLKVDNRALEWASSRIKNNKELVLESVQETPKTIIYASKEIQQLCQDKDPIQTLEKAIAYEKLQAQLKPKADEKPTQKLKI